MQGKFVFTSIIKEDSYSRKLFTSSRNLTGEQFNATIGFCRRSGLLVWGFEKVRATLLKEKAFLRIEALDGSDGEKLKLDSITIVPVLQSLYAYEMAATLGRKRIVHCALLKRDNKSVIGLASSLKEKSFRLAKFRMAA